MEITSASFQGMLRTLLIIILCYYAFKLLMRILAPYLMQKAAQKMQQKMQDQFGQQQRGKHQTSQQQKSTVKEKPKPTKKVGDYIDYEEID